MSAVIYPTTNLKATEQLIIDRGEGVYVYDNQGKQYLEGLSGLWCTGLGYNNQELIQTGMSEVSAARSTSALASIKQGTVSHSIRSGCSAARICQRWR